MAYVVLWMLFVVAGQSGITQKYLIVEFNRKLIGFRPFN